MNEAAGLEADRSVLKLEGWPWHSHIYRESEVSLRHCQRSESGNGGVQDLIAERGNYCPLARRITHESRVTVAHDDAISEGYSS
uniref:Uncharacterized protein n=1 Tax=Steinernema glaseri TaxID=37863 RepID=A0A1I7ZU23_9BILA